MTKIERESVNFKLPKSLSLVAALRAAAKERKITATELVIQGLHHILGDVPATETSVEVRLYQLEEEFCYKRLWVIVPWQLLKCIYTLDKDDSSGLYLPDDK